MKLLIALTLLVSSTTLHAYIGQSTENFKRDLGRGIFDEGKPSLFVSKMSWQGNPRDCKANHLKALGDPLWQIEVIAFVEPGKGGQTIHEICYHKRNKGPINAAELQQIKFNNKGAGLFLKTITPNRISITSKQFAALLAEKKQQFQKFKENYLCIGQTIQQLETRFGKGKQVNNANQAAIEWHFEKFDPAPTIKENWEIEVVLWKNLNDIEPVVQQVYYKRKTPFTPQELEWQRYINAAGKKWEENGVDAHFAKFKTKPEGLLAGVRVQQKEAVIYTQAFESALPFSACIGEDFDGLKQRVKVKHDKTFTAKTLPDNSTENFLFLEKYFVKNLKNPQKTGEHWDIEVLVWRDDNKVHEVSYTKAGKHLSPDEIRQIKNMNNREPIKEPILIEPNSIRPEKITVTSKHLLTQLAEKKQQFQKFKENYLCIGQTIQQLEKRFGKGKPVNNADQAVKEWHFEKFDPKSKENWEIEVVLWKNLNDIEPVVHQVYYKRKKSFSPQELEWQRYINAAGKKWEENGVDAHFAKFKTKPEGLLAGVRVQQQEAVIYTQAFESAIPFRACIGEDFDELKQRVKVRHGKRFTAKTLPDNSTENFLFLEKYFVKNLKTPQKPGEHWDIEVLVWRDDNKVHEVSYTKAGKHLSPDEIRQIKNMNNREPIKEPILIEPNSIRPEKITVTSKHLLTQLAEKKQQFQQFKENYLCLGQTIQQLEKRFGKGKPVNNADQAVKEWHFEKFDPAIKENWKIEVVLWKNLNDIEPVVHQVYYKRKTPFTPQELEWQRYIHAQRISWQSDGSDNFFRWKFISADKMLKAGIRVLQQEAVIQTQALHLQKQPRKP